MKNKKPLFITLICIVALALVAAGIWFFWLKDYLSAANATPVYVNPVSSIIGLNTGSTPRYSGIVEPQKTYKINKDESKTVAEVLVNVGDEIHAGDVLFRYDTEEMQFALEQAKIDQEGIANQISSLKTQLTELNKEKKNASKDDQYSYTVQIQSVEAQIKVQEYESSKKKSEIDKLQESLSNADVISEVEGIVKEVNNGSRTDPSGQTTAFISILSSGEYRIKGTVSELNFSSISEGQAVTVHSRLDPNQVWKGTVESIDQEAATDQNNSFGYYYGSMDSGEKSSKYNFYVLLENLDGLILGQHVYIEPDLGEDTKKEGLWLPAMYIAHDDDGSFVWAKNDKDKLEKRVVLLGDYDSGNDLYEIKSGVTKADYIAYPNENLKPGMPTTMDASLQGAYMTGGNDSMGGMQGETDNSLNDGMVDGTDGFSGGMEGNDLIPEGGVLPESNSDTFGEDAGFSSEEGIAA